MSELKYNHFWWTAFFDLVVWPTDQVDVNRKSWGLSQRASKNVLFLLSWRYQDAHRGFHLLSRASTPRYINEHRQLLLLLKKLGFHMFTETWLQHSQLVWVGVFKKFSNYHWASSRFMLSWQKVWNESSGWMIPTSTNITKQVLASKGNPPRLGFGF